uniref:Acidic phospholipase A2 2 n=2 Tax=Crotalinae TaxID=8710 RepID=PA2A2_CRAGM|nr:RecName: Full=Acidic phospholipase A2 2; Short=svPLA2; AltName: Full=Phosphatidylcholine 2-acylhydrolase; AltName: Full=Phospholipase A2 isozyme II; Short=PLA2-II [Trimeresurus gramineus]AAB24916.1 phospholipase A2-II, PLA2-II {EC 3.1.1.4} [Trimeresurus gramineus=green habu snakes, venom, Peptide, 122 aa] [Trimeresurus gramineus]
NLLQFENMIRNVAGRSGIWWYSDYGCYCGKGGHGRPQDASDRCCFVHDCCYGKVNGCNPKKAVYIYSLENGDIVCGGDDPCRKEVCECDKAAAICFRDNKDTYDNKYWNIPSENCQEESEPC